METLWWSDKYFLYGRVSSYERGLSCCLKGKPNLFLKNVVGGFPCTLHFRVRYFIPDPNTLQQEQTR